MEVLKKRYMYVQTYSDSKTMASDTLLGFHHGCDDGLNQRLVHRLTGQGLFPLYGFSFYENPPGRVIRQGGKNSPALFRSNRLYTLGNSSLVKIIQAQDMFNDDGLSFYRPLSFMMVIGRMENVFEDALVFLDVKEPGLTNHPVVGFLSRQAGLKNVLEKPELETIADQHAMLEAVGDLDYVSDTGYADSVYLMSGLTTSLVLSHITIRNLIEQENHGLEELLQVPVPDERYTALLSQVFGFDETMARHVETGSDTFPLCGISPGILGYDGVVLDVAKRTATGKRAGLVRFMLCLNQKKILDAMDLRYLI